MYQRTPKENFLGLAKGIPSEYVCTYTMGMKIAEPYRQCTRNVGPASLLTTPSQSAAMASGQESEWVNLWGIPYVSNAETGFAGLPKPGTFVLEDITKWDKVVKKPELPDGIDWEALAKADFEKAAFDRNESAVQTGVNFGPFQTLMGLMGFTNGLIAMVEEPEAVEELFNFLGDFYEPLMVKAIEHYKPDLVSMGDDTASKYAPFVSVSTYRRLLKPCYERIAKHATERGLPILFHNCGKAEDYADDMVDFGVTYWEPCQTENDILALKEKYNGRLIVTGAYDFVPDGPITEEQVRSSVREAMDKYAKGGGYVFCGNILNTAANSQLQKQTTEWIRSECHTYGGDFYKAGANA